MHKDFNKFIDNAKGLLVSEKQENLTPANLELLKYIKNNLAEFLALMDDLLKLRNSPSVRTQNPNIDKQKADFCAKWLKDKRVRARVISVENLDKTKKAGTKNYWHIVEAVIGAHENSTNPKDFTPLLMMAVHHDIIDRETADIKYEFSDEFNKLAHPWILDDTISVASAMFNAVRVNDWFKKQDPENSQGCFKLLITSGEEMNTLGMRGLLRYWEEKQQLHKIDFLLDGEATGRSLKDSKYCYELPNGYQLAQNKIPVIALIFRGKITGFIKGDASLSCFNAFCFVLSKFIISQRIVHKKSKEQDQNSKRDENLAETALSSTYGCFTNMSTKEGCNETNIKLFWEARTNKKMNTHGTFDLLNEVVEQDSWKKLKLKYAHTKDTKFHGKFAQDKDFISLDKKTEGENEYSVVTIKNGLPIHPGNYNAFKPVDGMFLAVCFLSFLTDEDKNNLVKIEYGSETKPNSVPNIISIYFKNPDFDYKHYKELILKHKDNLSHIFNAFLEESIDKFVAIEDEQNLVKLEVLNDPHVPPRDSLECKDDKIINLFQTTFKNNLETIFGIKRIKVKIGVFNAMVDAGATASDEGCFDRISLMHKTLSNDHELEKVDLSDHAKCPFTYRDILWGKSENVITFSAGDIHSLHGKEYISIEDLIIGLIQYEGVIQNVWKYFSKKRDS